MFSVEPVVYWVTVDRFLIASRLCLVYCVPVCVCVCVCACRQHFSLCSLHVSLSLVFILDFFLRSPSYTAALSLPRDLKAITSHRRSFSRLRHCPPHPTPFSLISRCASLLCCGTHDHSVLAKKKAGKYSEAPLPSYSPIAVVAVGLPCGCFEFVSRPLLPSRRSLRSAAVDVSLRGVSFLGGGAYSIE